MRFTKSALATVFAACLALPALAQTTQTSPVSPNPSALGNVARPSTTTPASRPAPSSATPGSSTAAGSTAAGTTGTSGTAASSLIDINNASAAQLDSLPGVGPARADAIIKNRPYKGKDDLVNRRIIPQNVYNGIKDKIIAKQS